MKARPIIRRSSLVQLGLAISVLAVAILHIWTRPDAILLRLRAGAELFVGRNFGRLQQVDPRIVAMPMPGFSLAAAKPPPTVPHGVDPRDVWSLSAGRAESNSFAI